MSISTQIDLKTYCKDVAERASAASRQLAMISADAKNRWLLASADALLAAREKVVAANALDLEAAPEYGLSDAQIDRLRLTDDRIQGIADGLRQVASLPDPIGQTIDGYRRPNGLEIQKIRVPLGVVFFIYESRPNVTADAGSDLCEKWQCSHFAWRQGSGIFQPRDC